MGSELMTIGFTQTSQWNPNYILTVHLSSVATCSYVRLGLATCLIYKYSGFPAKLLHSFFKNQYKTLGFMTTQY